jgi:hypothetical protein
MKEWIQTGTGCTIVLCRNRLGFLARQRALPVRIK